MSKYDSLISEREDLQQTLACADQVTREFDNMTSQLIMENAEIAVLSEEFRQLERSAGSYDWMRHASWPVNEDPIPQAAFQEIEQSQAVQNALLKELCDAAATYADELIGWAEDLDRREREQKLARQEKAQQPTAESTAAGTASNSPPSANPDLDGKIREIEEALSILQRQYDATQQTIQNLEKNSHWWDMDSNSLMEQFAQDAENLEQNIAQLKSALKVYQTAKATERVALEDLIEKVKAVYGPDWLGYFRQRILLGLDEAGPYWQLGEGARELEHMLTDATMTALMFAASEGMGDQAAGDSGEPESTAPLDFGPTIGNSEYRTLNDFVDAVTGKYQELYDAAHADTIDLVKQGLVQDDATVIGSRIDSIARVGLRDWLRAEGIQEGEGQIISVNRRLYDPLGSGKYRIPDVYIPAAGSILDGTISLKTANWSQVQDLWTFSGGSVTIIRPRLWITNNVIGSYSLLR